MRTIKFRAWDKKEKKMYYDIGISNTGVVMMWIDKSGGATFLGDGGNGLPEIIQFTGLKDKNGKEIFEGDICKNGDWEQDAHAYNYRIEVVEWDKDNAMWQGWNPNQDGMICEVIGNIYENKELLK